MLEDRWGTRGWSHDWRALPRRRRAELLAELRREEILRPPAHAHLAIREARRRLRFVWLRELAAVVAVLVVVVAPTVVFDPFDDPVRAVLETFAHWNAYLLVPLGFGWVWRTRAHHQQLRAGITRNVEGLRHWVEHGRAAALGPPAGREAALLAKLIEEEGWTRPHR